jgi:hypothetical protein
MTEVSIISHWFILLSFFTILNSELSWKHVKHDRLDNTLMYRYSTLKLNIVRDI